MTTMTTPAIDASNASEPQARDDRMPKAVYHAYGIVKKAAALVNEEAGRLPAWKCEAIVRADGSVQGIAELPPELKRIYRTAWEVPMRSLIDMAADRAPYIDQSQSLNLFMANPNIGQLSSMYMYAWKRGLKTTYYLRSRPATSIAKTTVAATASEGSTAGPDSTAEAAARALACSLENPQSCEACQ